MANKDVILGKLTPFANKRNMVKNNQQVPDIISAMLKAHEIYAKEYDKFSTDFYAGSDIKTAKKIFQFLKDNIKYKIDSEANQQIMSPSGILSIGKNDCKNYSLFIVGTLQSLKRKGLLNSDVFYRFASYKMFDEIPHHVFAVMRDKSGNETYIDPVLSSFNERKTYFHKIDKKPKMAIYSVSGINNQVGLFKSKRKKVEAAAATPASGEAPAAKPKKQKKKIVLKVALAPSRTAFLGLVALNFMGLATKLKKSIEKDAGKTSNWWKKLGGNPNKLIKTINSGAKKKRILGADIEFATEGQIGVAPAAAAAAAAAPLLIKVAEFLRSVGIEPKEILESGKEILSKQVKNAVDKKLKADEKLEDISDMQVNQAVDQAVEAKSGNMSKYLPFIIGGGVLLLFLAKKK